MNFLVGKKTFIVAAVMALHAIVVTGWLNNQWVEAQQEFLTACGLVGLRLGINNK